MLACLMVSWLLTGEAHGTAWNPTGLAVRGDFNGDGVHERVVSSPETDNNKGVVYVVDAAAGTATAWTRDTSGLLGGGASADDYFGAALTVGDFDNDGYDDLVIGAPGADDSGETDSGVIHVIYGSASGLTTTGDQIFHQDTVGIEGVAEPGDQFGDVLTTGDFDCNGYDDVAIGVPLETGGSGAVQVFYGSSGGVSVVDDLYTQGMGGNGAFEAGDHFGGALVAANFNGDISAFGVACDDLAIASPDEDVGSTQDAGYVWQILGSTSGLTTTGSLAWHQDTTGVQGVAEENDRFGLRMFAGDKNDDGYDDLFVAVPGDSCIAGHGEGLAIFYGTSTGITLTGNELECHGYRCEIDESSNFYACHTSSPTIHASAGADNVHMFHGNDIAYGRGGNDQLGGGHGDDIIFGGDGDDVIGNGPGLDVAIGGNGDDTFVITLDCQVVAGEVIDGGPGSDTVESHRTQTQLEALGLTFRSIETFSTISEGSGDCTLYPAEEGPWRRPRVTMIWDDLPNPDSIFSSASSTLDLSIVNNDIDTQTLTVNLTFWLTVHGFTVKLTDSTTLAHQGSTIYQLDIEDFIPGGIDPQLVPERWLDLSTSARLVATAEITISGEPYGAMSAPTLYGHLEDGGTELVVYREKALEDTYYYGDLNTWRWSGPSPSPGHGHVFQGYLVATP